jgi:hypothetical protein
MMMSEERRMVVVMMMGFKPAGVEALGEGMSSKYYQSVVLIWSRDCPAFSSKFEMHHPSWVMSKFFFWMRHSHRE